MLELKLFETVLPVGDKGGHEAIQRDEVENDLVYLSENLFTNMFILFPVVR